MSEYKEVEGYATCLCHSSAEIANTVKNNFAIYLGKKWKVCLLKMKMPTAFVEFNKNTDKSMHRT